MYLVTKLNVEESILNSEVINWVCKTKEEALKIFREEAELMKEDYEAIKDEDNLAELHINEGTLEARYDCSSFCSKLQVFEVKENTPLVTYF